MNSTRPNLVRVSWDFLYTPPCLFSCRPDLLRGLPIFTTSRLECFEIKVDKSRSRLLSLFPNLRPWEMNGRWGVRSGLALFKDKKCLSFVLKVNVKMSVRSSYHNCPECVVTVLSYPSSLPLFSSDSICWKLWPYRSRTFALSDVFIHPLSFWMRLLCLKFDSRFVHVICVFVTWSHYTWHMLVRNAESVQWIHHTMNPVGCYPTLGLGLG